jgi:hypothetical protein
LDAFDLDTAAVRAFLRDLGIAPSPPVIVLWLGERAGVRTDYATFCERYDQRATKGLSRVKTTARKGSASITALVPDLELSSAR